MGFYDYVRISPGKLPVTEQERELLKDACNGDFQTKDLECILTTFEITDDGRLRLLQFEYEEVPEEQRLFPHAEGKKGLIGSVRRINERWTELNEYTGKLNFYTTIKNDVWYEFRATFIKGKLDRIVKVQPSVQQQGMQHEGNL